jgi:hypothetical protein
VTPHIVINGAVSKNGAVRKTAVDRRTTRHAGYRLSKVLRWRIEEAFDWIKAQAGLAQSASQECWRRPPPDSTRAALTRSR